MGKKAIFPFELIFYGFILIATQQWTIHIWSCEIPLSRSFTVVDFSKFVWIVTLEIISSNQHTYTQSNNFSSFSFTNLQKVNRRLLFICWQFQMANIYLLSITNIFVSGTCLFCVCSLLLCFVLFCCCCFIHKM